MRPVTSPASAGGGGGWETRRRGDNAGALAVVLVAAALAVVIVAAALAVGAAAARGPTVGCLSSRAESAHQTAQSTHASAENESIGVQYEISEAKCDQGRPPAGQGR